MEMEESMVTIESQGRIILLFQKLASELDSLTLAAFRENAIEVLCVFGTAQYKLRSTCHTSLKVVVLSLEPVVLDVIGSSLNGIAGLTRMEYYVHDKVIRRIVPAYVTINATAEAELDGSLDIIFDSGTVLSARNSDSSEYWQHVNMMTELSLSDDDDSVNPVSGVALSLIVTSSGIFLLSCVCLFYFCCCGATHERSISPFLAVKKRGKARLYYNANNAFSLAVRALPQAWEPPIGVIHPGDRVTVIEESNGWYKIQNKSGWGEKSRHYVWARTVAVDAGGNEHDILKPVQDASSFYPLVNINGVQGLELDLEGLAHSSRGEGWSSRSPPSRAAGFFPDAERGRGMANGFYKRGSDPNPHYYPGSPETGDDEYIALAANVIRSAERSNGRSTTSLISPMAHYGHSQAFNTHTPGAFNPTLRQTRPTHYIPGDSFKGNPTAWLGTSSESVLGSRFVRY
jgi:hypothetical protein